MGTVARQPLSGAAGGAPAGGNPRPDLILRFHKSERMVHWAIAVPFLICYTSAAILVLFYNTGAVLAYRGLFSWIHRIAALFLIVLPAWALLSGRGESRIHLDNIRQAWVWTLDDLRWLSRIGLAAVCSRITLPEQGKFNAAEKLNFMMVMTTYPLYIVTGVMIWLPGVAFLSWIAHLSMAALATPLILGHIFMATINRDTRAGLQGMISGFVDREWAKHHYRCWYRENFERSIPPLPPLQRPARIHCSSCDTTQIFTSWAWLLRRIFSSDPLPCPGCHNDLAVLSAITDPQVLDEILRHLHQGGSDAPFRRSLPPAA